MKEETGPGAGRGLDGLTVVLDNVRSAFNVGAIFRAADACRVERIFLCGITAHPPSSKLDKTALGSTEFVRWEYFRSTPQALERLQEEEVPVFGVEVRAESVPLWKVRFPEKVGIVFGHELWGVSEEALSRVDGLVSLPMLGIKNSHNVSTACGIVLFEALRQRLARGGETEANDAHA